MIDLKSVQIILYDEDGESFSVDVHDVHRMHELERDHSGELTDAEDTGELPSVGGI